MFIEMVISGDCHKNQIRESTEKSDLVFSGMQNYAELDRDPF